MALLRKKKQKLSLGFIAFLQAFGLLIYCTLVANLIWNGQRWFPRISNFTGPLLFLTLFSTSALICGLIVGSYPFLLFWEKKKTKEAIKLVIYTASWAIFFVAGILYFLFSSH
ncbi:hypothetical protein HY029_05470 [Candidatus Gottesmanbacteria bacterium]|nr:hypothetical protein [Candidatus Gottesmanbacteria bacterium]